MAGSDATSLADTLRETVECSICQETFNDPRALPCLHTYCLECLRQHCKGRATPSCPLCRHEFSITDRGADDFPKNFHMENLISFHAQILSADGTRALCEICRAVKRDGVRRLGDVVATRMCLTCEKRLCDSCAKEHSKQKKHQQVVPFTETQCNQHPSKLLDKYCASCSRICCSVCLTDQHDGHQASDVRVVAKDIREQVGVYTTCAARLLSIEDNRISSLNARREQFLRAIANVESRMKDASAEIKNQVDEDSKTLLSESGLIKTQTMSRVAQEQQRLEHKAQVLRSFVENCRKLTNEGHETAIIREFNGLKTSWSDIQKGSECETNREPVIPDLVFVKHEFRRWLPHQVKSSIGEIRSSAHRHSSAGNAELSWDELNAMMHQKVAVDTLIMQTISDRSVRASVDMTCHTTDLLAKCAAEVGSKNAELVRKGKIIFVLCTALALFVALTVGLALNC